MPVPPGSWSAGPVTAKALNTALYSVQPGNNHKPDGILFHANRPLLVEAMASTAVTQPSSSGGTFKSLAGSANWKNYFDSSVLFGPGADSPYNTAAGTFTPAVFASDGISTDQPGGYYVAWGFPAWTATRNAGASGAGLLEAGGTVAGGAQFSGTARPNCSYVLDAVQLGTGQTVNLMGYCSDSSGSAFTVTGNSTDYSGAVTRFGVMWAGVALDGGTVGTVPAPTVWAALGTVTSALLNGNAVNLPLTLLNNPPLLRAGSLLATSITSGSAVTVPLGTPQIDTYAAYSVSTRAWTAPLDGVYLVHGCAYYASGATNSMYAGLSINSGALVLYGPACQSAGSGNTCCQVTRLLDLHAGDTVKLVTLTNGASNTLGSGFQCRLVSLWMSALAPSNGAWSWTPPSTGFRWQAGSQGSTLIAQFAQHLTNDLSFLLQRPYLLAYQGTAQTGLSQNAFHTVTMDTVAGRVHATAGDSYGGWQGTASTYAAPVNGWYLVLDGFAQSVPVSTPASCTAAILQSPAGSASPDQYQQATTVTTSQTPGAEGIGAYYLRAGDTVAPQYRQQDGGTFSTSVAAGRESSFGVMWLCN